MKKILLTKKRYQWKDIFRYLSIFIMHYIAFAIFVFLIMLIGFSFKNQTFHGIFMSNLSIKLYMIIFGPAISAISHIIYDERGLLWLRGFMWCHDFVIGALFIILEFY